MGQKYGPRTGGRTLAPIQPHLQLLAAASSAGISLEANRQHITTTLATWDAVRKAYLDPKWARQWLRLYGAQEVAPRILPQPPCSLPTPQPATSEPGPSTPPPAKRSKRTKAVQAAEPAQPTKGNGRGKGKAAKAKQAPHLGRWLDKDCNAALNMQRIGESRQPAKGKEYPELGYKRLQDRSPKAQQQQQRQPVAQ
ncbi:hypothetical protein QJQ45_001198 [Haematococcus lacustris]|nr:hypothetical protein QJQ45_001198 [Haematococcus lacustris]